MNISFRWAVTLFSCIALLQSAHAAPKTDQWNFRVFLDDREIGYHRVQLEENAQAQRINVEADFKVRVLFLTAYKYQHSANEVWRNGCLSEIQTETNDNGESLFLRSSGNPESMAIETTTGRAEYSGCVRSFAYWNPELLETDRLLNTQSGEYEQVNMVDHGLDTLDIRGEKVTARKWILSAGDKDIILWYTADQDWLALQTRVKGNRLLSYFRQEDVTS